MYTMFPKIKKSQIKKDIRIKLPIILTLQSENSPKYRTKSQSNIPHILIPRRDIPIRPCTGQTPKVPRANSAYNISCILISEKDMYIHPHTDQTPQATRVTSSSKPSYTTNS